MDRLGVKGADIFLPESDFIKGSNLSQDCKMLVTREVLTTRCEKTPDHILTSLPPQTLTTP